MKTTDESATTPSKPRAVKRQADRSILSTDGDSGLLLHFEDPKLLAFVRHAVEAKLQPATDLDRILTELAVRNLWRAIRSGSIEAFAADVEMGERANQIVDSWGQLDPRSKFHLSTREAPVRASVQVYAKTENEAVRNFKHTAALAKSFQS